MQGQPSHFIPSAAQLSVVDGCRTEVPPFQPTSLVLPPAITAPSSGPAPLITPVPLGQGNNALSTSDVPNQSAAKPTTPRIHNGVPLYDALSSGDNDTSSGSSSDVIQFKSALDIGDYVAVRPFVPIVDGGQVQQGYVKEFANDESFQASGVLVVLTDNTIGFVTALLDHAAVVGEQRIHRRGESSNGSKSRGGLQNLRMDGPGSSTGNEYARLVTSEGALSSDQLSEWALSTREAPAIASSVDRLERTAASAQRDSQLLKEFAGLEEQYGQGVCNAILHDCNLDLREAIAFIKAQAEAHDSSPAIGIAGPDNAAMSTSSGADAATAQVDEELAQQLALSLGLDGDSALSLCKLAPMASAQGVVDALYQHGGDMQQAANALLSGASNSTTGANNFLAVHHSGSNSSNKDGNLVAGALQLCEWFPHLSRDTAEMLLLEHGGDVDRVSRIVVLSLDPMTFHIPCLVRAAVPKHVKSW